MARGYGEAHRRLRRLIAPFVMGGMATCARCGRPIVPGQRWDLGHHDIDRRVHVGPEHALAADCPKGGNRATAGRRGRRTSRAW